MLMGVFMMLVQIHRSSGAVIANELAARGYTPSQIATVVSATFLAAALFQLPTGIFFDRYGTRFTLAGTGLVAIVGIVLFALSDSVLGLASGRFLIGLGHAGVIAGVYMLAVTWVPANRVATTTGTVVAIAGGIGGMLGTVPLVLALESLGHQRTFLTISALTLVMTVAIGLYVRDAPPGQDGEATGRGETLAQSLRGLWAVLMERRLWPVFAMGACFSMPFATVGGLWAGPYLLDIQGLNKEQAGFAVLVMVAAFHLGNLGYGPVERAFATRKWTIVGGVLAMIALLSVIAVLPGPGLVSAVLLLTLVCLCAPFYPVLAAHTRGFVPLSRVGRAIACVNLMGLTTLFLMQKFTGWLVEITASAEGETTALGYRLAFASIAVALVLALLGYLRVRDVPP
jgi:predicted MFS family arabinose efflux permease